MTTGIEIALLVNSSARMTPPIDSGSEAMMVNGRKNDRNSSDHQPEHHQDAGAHRHREAVRTPRP